MAFSFGAPAPASSTAEGSSSSLFGGGGFGSTASSLFESSNYEESDDDSDDEEEEIIGFPAPAPRTGSSLFDDNKQHTSSATTVHFGLDRNEQSPTDDESDDEEEVDRTNNKPFHMHIQNRVTQEFIPEEIMRIVQEQQQQKQARAKRRMEIAFVFRRSHDRGTLSTISETNDEEPNASVSYTVHATETAVVVYEHHEHDDSDSEESDSSSEDVYAIFRQSVNRRGAPRMLLKSWWWTSILVLLPTPLQLQSLPTKPSSRRMNCSTTSTYFVKQMNIRE
jgi:hypothetical protein